MVNLTRFLFGRSKRKPFLQTSDPFWRKRQILKLSGHIYGRSRNCFCLAIRRVQKSMLMTVTRRATIKNIYKQVWEARIDASAQEIGHLPEGSRTLLEGLNRSDVHLNRQSLASLATWEPRSFAVLNKIAAVRASEEKIARYLGPFPKGILGKL